MSLSKIEDFIRVSTEHAAKCGKQLVLVDRSTNIGSYVRQTWKCPCCGEELRLANCDMVRSNTVAEGDAYSRKQPDLNMRIINGAALSGINLTKVQELMSLFLGIKIANDRNMRRMNTKVRSGIKETYNQRKDYNRKEHCAAARALHDYTGDVIWNVDGEQRLISCGSASMDGGGPTRFYGNKPRGRQSAFVCNSLVTKKPLGVIVSQVSN